MDLSLVILGIVLIFVLYYFLNRSGTDVLSNKLDLSIPQPAITIDKISDPTSRKYSYEMWMYVFNFTGNTNYIISRASGSGKNIGIKLDSSSPTLKMEYTATATGSTTSPTSPSIASGRATGSPGASSRRSARPPRPCRRRRSGSGPPGPCGRCATHWSRRYCPIRRCGYRPRRPAVWR